MAVSRPGRNLWGERSTKQSHLLHQFQRGQGRAHQWYRATKGCIILEVGLKEQVDLRTNNHSLVGKIQLETGNFQWNLRLFEHKKSCLLCPSRISRWGHNKGLRISHIKIEGYPKRILFGRSKQGENLTDLGCMELAGGVCGVDIEVV